MTAPAFVIAQMGDPGEPRPWAEFFVEGVPEPKGSMTTKVIDDGISPPRTILYQGRSKRRKDGTRSDGPRRIRAWAERVAAAARVWQITHRRRVIDEEAVGVELLFLMPRPPSLPKRIKLPIKKPDLDKLYRLVGDCLKKAEIISDDARIVDTLARKRFAIPPMTPRVVIKLWTVTE